MLTVNVKAAKLLKDCETGLLALAAQATQERDYESIKNLIAAAEVVAGAAADFPDADHHAAPRPAQTTGAATKRKAGKATDYPIYRRDVDELLRVGWSKKEKREYQQRAPEHVLLAICQLFLDAPDSFVRTDQALPLELSGKGMVPNYQAYLWLGWLKNIGLVSADGRGSYRNLVGRELVDRATSTWNTHSVN